LRPLYCTLNDATSVRHALIIMSNCSANLKAANQLSSHSDLPRRSKVQRGEVPRRSFEKRYVIRSKHT